LLGGMPMSMRGAMAIVIALIALAVTAHPAHAATTRAEYVAQVDPICQAGLAQEDAAAKPVLKKLKRINKHRRQAHTRKARVRLLRQELRTLASFFDFVATVEQGVNAQIATIPPPIEDTSLVQVWLRVRGEAVVTTQRLLRSFAKGDIFGALDLLFEVEAKSAEASDLVRDFGFHYCTSPAEQLGL
jgi:hypothetical protein